MWAGQPHHEDMDVKCFGGTLRGAEGAMGKIYKIRIGGFFLGGVALSRKVKPGEQ